MIQTINISLIPSDNKPVINVSQFDNVSRVLRFNVFDDVEMTVPHVFDNTETVLLNIRKNDNNIVVITGVIVSDIDPETQEVTEQYLTFELTEQACACVGSNFGEVSITSGDDEVIGSCNFKLVVERSPLAGGISSQTEIDNLTTQIEEITEEVIGENYYDKEEIDDKFDDLDIPTKTSQLTNDSGFITASDIPTIPTKTSQLTNDSGFITASDIPTIPTKTSQLTNDSGFITASDIPTIPTKTSQLTNDSDFTTIDDAATVNNKTWSSEKISDELYEMLPTGTVGGVYATFNTALEKPLISCEVDSGATKIYKWGKNLASNIDGDGYVDSKYLYVDGSLGESSTNPQNWFVTEYIKCPNKLCMSCLIGSHNPSICFYDENKNFISGVSYVGSTNLTFNIPFNAKYFRASISRVGNYLFEINTEPTDYEAFKSVEYDVSEINTIITFSGVNNIFADAGDISVTYKDTIKNYIDTRVPAASNRTLSLMRSSETFESLEPIERGDNNENER